ncbi:triacylglycerol lipase [Savitreella phatthalungensis]
MSMPDESGAAGGKPSSDHTPALLLVFLNLFRLISDVFIHYKRRLDKRLRPVRVLSRALDSAEDFNQWEDIAERLDEELGNDVWRRNSASRRYDHKVIFQRLQKLRNARVVDDTTQLTYLLRTGLLRNLANIADKELFNRSYLGTKFLIGEYVTEVMHCLEHIAALPAQRLSQEAKLQFFRDTKHSYGLTCLVLQGGAAFGLFHIGIVKALWQQGLLPTVLSGNAIGSLVAAQVCSATDDELSYLLADDHAYDLRAFEKRRKGQTLRKLKRFWKQGFLLDISVLAECCRDNLGDITFEEAFKRSNRVLNIAIHSTTSQQQPSLLNYLTAPNVLIWTAALASNALPGLYEPVELLCRDSDGEIVPWAPMHGVRYTAASTGTPYERVSELFNVNNFIISQARPYLVPFLSQPLHRRGAGTVTSRILKVLALELEHRISQLATIGLVPFGTRLWVRNNLKLPRSELTLVPPDLGLRDFFSLLRAPSYSDVSYWSHKGERAVWPAMGLLRVRMLVEVTLRECFEDLRHKEALAAADTHTTQPGGRVHAATVSTGNGPPSATISALGRGDISAVAARYRQAAMNAQTGSFLAQQRELMASPASATNPQPHLPQQQQVQGLARSRGIVTGTSVASQPQVQVRSSPMALPAEAVRQNALSASGKTPARETPTHHTEAPMTAPLPQFRDVWLTPASEKSTPSEASSATRSRPATGTTATRRSRQNSTSTHSSVSAGTRTRTAEPSESSEPSVDGNDTSSQTSRAARRSLDGAPVSRQRQESPTTAVAARRLSRGATPSVQPDA